MAVSPLAWCLAIALIAGLLLIDFFFHARKAHVPSLREAATWTSVYVGIALLFGVALLVLGGTQAGTEYFASYVTEKALSIDNVFVFVMLMSSFKVPRPDQQKVLLFGIVFSLTARTGLIFLGAALINSFAWVFYFFGVTLLATAGNLLKPHDLNAEGADIVIVRIARKLFRTTDSYDGDRLVTLHEGRRTFTPMLPVMLAIGGTDVLFALDSIPAIFGLTRNVFIVFTATAFSLLGLRQLYFLIDGLLERLLYLSYGLALILGFIGVKLILHALHENNLPFINDGHPIGVIEVGTGTSLLAILAILLVTVVVSLRSPKGKTKTAVTALRRDVADYLDPDSAVDAAQRERIYARLVESERKVMALEPRLRQLIREPEKLKAALARVHRQHGSAAAAPRD